MNTIISRNVLTYLYIYTFIFLSTNYFPAFAEPIKIFIKPIRCSPESDFAKIICDDFSDELRRYLMKSPSFEFWEDENMADVVVEGEYYYKSANDNLTFFLTIKRKDSEDKISGEATWIRRHHLLNEIGRKISLLLIDKDVIDEELYKKAIKSDIFYTREFQEKRKSPFDAYLITMLTGLFVGGSGHFYAHDYLRGSILTVLTIGTWAFISQAPFSENPEVITTGDIAVFGLLGIWLYAQIDALIAADRYNNKLLEEMSKNYEITLRNNRDKIFIEFTMKY